MSSESYISTCKSGIGNLIKKFDPRETPVQDDSEQKYSTADGSVVPLAMIHTSS